ncbi:hypothetical protein GCM10010400_49320 [Streptomyces aculeolatus]
MNQANGGAPTPDSDRLPEPRPAPRKRGTRCACGATRNLRPLGQWGVICPPCRRDRGTHTQGVRP